MGTWQPATAEEVRALLEAAMDDLHPAHRVRFERMRVPMRRVPVDDDPGATVMVVAEREGRMLYWSDIEDGWEWADPTASGGIRCRGSSQFELSHILWQLFGDPTRLR